MKPETFRKLASAGLTTEQIALVLEIMDEREKEFAAAEDARKAQVRERVQRWRDKQKGDDNVTVTLPKRDGNATKRLTHVEDNNLTTEISGEDINTTAPKARGGDLADFKAELSKHLDPERVEAIVKHRRSKRGQLTGHAAKLFIRDAADCRMSLPDAVDACISRNWITVKPEYFQGRQVRSTAPPQKQTIGEMFRDEAKQTGLIHEKPTSTSDGRLGQGQRGGEDSRPSISRRFAVTSNLLGSIG